QSRHEERASAQCPYPHIRTSTFFEPLKRPHEIVAPYRERCVAEIPGAVAASDRIDLEHAIAVSGEFAGSHRRHAARCGHLLGERGQMKNATAKRGRVARRAPQSKAAPAFDREIESVLDDLQFISVDW